MLFTPDHKEHFYAIFNELVFISDSFIENFNNLKQKNGIKYAFREYQVFFVTLYVCFLLTFKTL